MKPPCSISISVNYTMRGGNVCVMMNLAWPVFVAAVLSVEQSHSTSSCFIAKRLSNMDACVWYTVYSTPKLYSNPLRNTSKLRNVKV